MKKRYVFIIGIIIVIGIGVLLFFMNYQTKLDHKISLIEQKYFETDDIKGLQENTENIAVISVGDNEQKAIVIGKNGKNFEEIYKEAKKDIKKEIKQKKYSVNNVRIDFAKTIEEVSMEQFEKGIKQTQIKNLYKNGIILDYENAEDIILTQAEINSNCIIDYIKSEIDLSNLNSYMEFCGKNKVEEYPEKIKIFTCISYFCDENDNVYELYSDEFNTQRRKIEKLENKDIEEILNNSCKYLLNMIQEDGQFIYGYSALFNKQINGYDIIRHAGAVWALSAKCEVNEENSQKISSCIDYLYSNSVDKDDQTYIKKSKTKTESQLGANGLGLVAISEYIEHFQDTKYLELAKRLGNAIIAMQQEDGKLIHEIDTQDFTISREYITEYYDNEATLGLLKLYGITKEEKYLQAAEKSLQYFIKNDYASRGSHWFSYALNEVTKYVDKEEYYKAGLQNIEGKLNKIANKKTTSHTDFEMLLQGFELYDRILTKNLEIDEIKSFPAKKFLNTIQNRADFQLNSYLYPEIAMYLKNPGKYENTFYIVSDDYRIRIDDVQHSMFGYMRYQENQDKISNYLKEGI